MKEITLFILPSCPHCKLALHFKEELFRHYPQFQSLSIRVINEQVEAELANRYDYYYVPTFYVGEDKVHEGHAEPEDVERVLRLAMEA